MASYIVSPKLSQPKKFYIIILAGAIIMQIISVLIFTHNGLFPIIFALVLAAIFLITAFSLDRSYYLFAAYFVVLPEKYYIEYFPGVPVGFMWVIGYLLFLLIVLYWIIYVLNNRITFSIKKLDLALLIFITSFVISAVLGILRRHNFPYWRLEFMALSLFLTYFIFLYSPLKNNPKRFYDFIVFCSLLIAFQFLASMIRLGGTIFLIRVVSMHIHMSQLAISYICATLIYSASRKKKIILGIILPLILLSVIISQQRALWGSTLVILSMILLIYIYERRKWIRENVLKIGLSIFAAITILLISSSVVNSLTAGKLYNTVISRGSVLFSLEQMRSDESYRIRTAEIAEAMQTIGSDFIFGKGLGASTMTRWRFMEHATVDNSYVYVYWKMGILGILGFFSFYTIYFLRSLKLLRQAITIKERIFTVATLLNFIALFIVGLTNVCLVHYRFILIWVASIAIIESIARKYD